MKLADDPAAARELAGRDTGHGDQGAHGRAGVGHPGSGYRFRGLCRARAGPGHTESPYSWSRPEGGIDIEEVAAYQSGRDHASWPWIRRYGLLPHQAMGLAWALYDNVKLARDRQRAIIIEACTRPTSGGGCNVGRDQSA